MTFEQLNRITPFHVDQQDIFTQESFSQNIQLARKLKTPYYLLGVIEINPHKNQETHCNYYDGINLAYHSLNHEANNTLFVDPLTKSSSLKIHYFITSLFKFDSQCICSEESTVNFQSFDLKKYKLEQRNILLTALNFHILAGTANDDIKLLVRDSQEAVATLIKSRKIYFDPGPPDQESIKFLWCATHCLQEENASQFNLHATATLAYTCLFQKKYPFEAAALKIYNELKSYPLDKSEDNRDIQELVSEMEDCIKNLQI